MPGEKNNVPSSAAVRMEKGALPSVKRDNIYNLK